MPKVCVIVPVYKVEAYIRRCIDSILCQTFTDFKLILVDDGSPDSSGLICDEYADKDHRIVVIHKKNEGVAVARNTGLDWAYDHLDNEWLTFVDSDDWIHPEYLERLLNAAIDGKVNISACGYVVTNGESPEIVPDELNPVEWGTETFYVERNVNAVVPWSKLYHRDCFRTARYPVGKISEDEFLTYQILFRFPTLAVISAPLYCYFVIPNRVSESVSGGEREDKYDALEQQIQYFKENSFELACRAQIRLYFLTVHDKIQKLSKDVENKAFLKAMIKRKRCHFPIYARMLNPQEDSDAFVLTKVFPKRMKIYWNVRAIGKKMRILSKKVFSIWQ